MNALQSFFKQYHAVPANDAGPAWGKATDEALLGWAAADCRTWDANESARPHLRARMVEIDLEIGRRMEVGHEETIPEEIARHHRDPRMAPLNKMRTQITKRVGLQHIQPRKPKTAP